MSKLTSVIPVLVCAMAGCEMKVTETPVADIGRRTVTAPVAVPAKATSHYLSGGEGSFDLNSFRGHVVLLDITAFWSEPCRRDVPLLNRLHEELAAQGLAVVGLAVDRTPAPETSVAVQQAGAIYPVAQGVEEILQALGGVRALPTRLLIDRKGAVRHTFAGAVPVDEVRTNVLALLQEG